MLDEPERLIDYESLPLCVNQTYYPHIWDRSRFLIFFGGAGSGKSVFIAQRIVYLISTEDGHNWLVIRQVANTNRFSTFALILQIISSFGVSDFFTVNKTEMTITFTPNGNSIMFAGLDDVEKLKSITFANGPLTDVWIEEASEVSEDSFNQINLRLRGTAAHPFQIVLSFNPISAMHWIKGRFFDRVVKNCTIVKTTYLDNLWIDATYKAELEALRDRDYIAYQVYALGEWGSAGNLIFTNYIFEPCKYRAEDFDMIVAGMDFGYNHYSSIELIGIKDGELYSFAELYERQKTNTDLIMLNSVLPKSQRCVADSAEPKSIEEWKRAGYTIDEAKKGPDSVISQIRYLKGRRWHIDPDTCPGLAAEVGAYSWRVTKDGVILDEPLAFKDDAIAACRYAIEHLIAPRKFEAFF